MFTLALLVHEVKAKNVPGAADARKHFRRRPLREALRGGGHGPRAAGLVPPACKAEAVHAEDCHGQAAVTAPTAPARSHREDGTRWCRTLRLYGANTRVPLAQLGNIGV